MGAGFLSAQPLFLILGAAAYSLGWIYLPDLPFFRGYLQRTLRGRIATPAIYRHFGLAEPASAVVRDLLAEE